MHAGFVVGAPHMRQRGRASATCCATAGSRAAEAKVPLLRLEDVHYRIPMDFDRIVFHSLNFAVYPGEMVLLTGHNGSGKSTALQLMNGLLEPERGKTYWKEEPLKKPSHMVRNVGVVMQIPGKYFYTMTVLDELTLGRPDVRPDDVRRVMTDVGLRDISLRQRPQRLSGGQKRRLALASQMIRKPMPELFTLDEPLVGVDWIGRNEIIRLLGELKSKFAMVIVSHEPYELLHLADRVVQVAYGRIYETPRHVIDKALEFLERNTAERRAKAARVESILS